MGHLEDNEQNVFLGWASDFKHVSLEETALNQDSNHSFSSLAKRCMKLNGQHSLRSVETNCSFDENDQDGQHSLESVETNCSFDEDDQDQNGHADSDDWQIKRIHW